MFSFASTACLLILESFEAVVIAWWFH